MRSIRLALILATIAGAAHAAPAPAPTLSKRQARAISTEALTRRVMQQLGDILVEGPRPMGKPTRPLSDLWFRIRPHETDFKDVCASESVTVRFDHGTRLDADGETPAQAVGLEVRPSFHVGKDGRAIRCDRLRPFDDRFIFADNAELARAAVQIVAKIATEPDVRNAVQCDRPCPDGLKTLTPDDIFGANKLQTSPDRPSGEYTLSIDLGDLNLQVSYVQAGGRMTIRQAKLSEMVTVADTKID